MFCDQGVPNGHGRWNAYDELAHQLTQLGVPKARVRFMQSARNDREKGELFAACRAGQVAVLIGSTERMGVGTNIQTRAVALHHIDCPWRPADIAQRDGRIVRQGNLNTEIEILRYVTEGSFDAYCWQTVERKATFIHQLMRASLDIREIEDIGDITLSVAETKALATGDPRIMQKAQLDSDLGRLERLERFHRRNQRSLTERIATCQKQLPHLQQEHEQLTGILQALPATKPESFTITIGTTRFTKRAEAATEIRSRLLQIPPLSRTGTTTATRIGTINDLPIRAQHVHGMYDSIRIDLAGVPRSTIDIRPRELDTERPLGIITKLENCVSRIPRSLQEVATETAKTHNEIDQAEAHIGPPFPRHDELEELRRRCIALTEELAETHTEIDTPAIGGPVAVQVEQHNGDWAELCRAIEPTLASDPYWPTLTKALEKCSAHGVDIPAAINRAHAAAPLPAADPARTLHYRLVAEHPATLLGGTTHQPTPPDTPTAPILDHHHAPSVRPPQGPHHGR